MTNSWLSIKGHAIIAFFLIFVLVLQSSNEGLHVTSLGSFNCFRTKLKLLYQRPQLAGLESSAEHAQSLRDKQSMTRATVRSSDSDELLPERIGVTVQYLVQLLLHLRFDRKAANSLAIVS